jgi:hypothetical protein
MVAADIVIAVVWGGVLALLALGLLRTTRTW